VGFYDAIDHGWLVKFIKHRIGDGRVLRLIQKWLRAGVMEQGKRLPTDIGSPQGATVSPLLANICLHYALDLWVQQWRGRHAHGDVIIVRYADDFLVGFQHYSDAQQFMQDLRERLARFKLELHPEKTRSSPSGDTPRSGVRVEVSRARRQPLISLGLRTAADARGTGSLCWCVVQCVPV
jgi:RNA-directed DNA polymerase